MKQKWSYLVCPCCGNASPRRNVILIMNSGITVGKEAKVTFPKIMCPICEYMLDKSEENECLY